MNAHAPPQHKPPPLAQLAITTLADASVGEAASQAAPVEERNVWQPGSWLLQRCWEALASAGAADEALAVAALMQHRHPLAPLQALHRLAQGSAAQHPIVLAELARYTGAAHPARRPAGDAQYNERLLQAAATAALVGDLPLACACLERLDQLEGAWAQVFARSELRLLLAESTAHIALHPLTTSLVDNAIRRFGDAGAQFLHDVVMQATPSRGLSPARPDEPPARPHSPSLRLLQRCVETFRYAALSTLQSRRLAAITFGRAALVDELLSQLALIASVQDAHRETGFSRYQDDTHLVRQVKRPNANSDVDFQVFTLQQAIQAMPIRQIPRQQRIALADQMAWLGARSDGWTAAGAAATLVELGALKYAVEVVERTPPSDPGRGEGLLALVRGLLAVEEPAMAAEQAQAALAWARARPDRTPERAVIRGLAEIYLQQGLPDQALCWLEQWPTPTGWRRRLATYFRQQIDDDGLRLHGLRLRARLQGGSAAAEAPALVGLLQTWAPRLLEGEALLHFLVDNLLRPLLASADPAMTRLAQGLLPDLARALATASGHKHASHLAAVAGLLAQALAPADAALRQAAESFLAQLWQADARRGLWQVIHGIEGSMPLLLALEGPPALVAIARAASKNQQLWHG